MSDQSKPRQASWSRRQFLAEVGGIGVAGAFGMSAGLSADQGLAATSIQQPFANGRRPLSADFPQKRAMAVLRSRPPMLETPFAVFDQGLLTPNDRFYVRWHLADIPTTVDATAFRLHVRGHVGRSLSLSLTQLRRQFESYEVVAVNQCAGNSRGFSAPRVAGGQWGHGAMGNARWRGVRLRDLLDRAGVKAGAVQVRFNGLDAGLLPATPDFTKALAIDHARSAEVMVAYAMNGEPLPLLNGFPLRLVVPGWFGTYWIKMLHDIEVLSRPDEGFWMTKAYLVPDTVGADVTPGQTGVKMVPISRMPPRSFFTNLQDGETLQAVGGRIAVRGIAFGGDAGVAKVLVSADGGRRWQAASLGEDLGRYSFRRWETALAVAAPSRLQLLVKAQNLDGVVQPERAPWNGGGYSRNVAEAVAVQVI